MVSRHNTGRGKWEEEALQEDRRPEEQKERQKGSGVFDIACDKGTRTLDFVDGH
jgi:hypothetical protein